MKINVIVVPWSKKNLISKELDILGQEIYKIHLMAKPIWWEANKQLILNLADYFDIPKRNIKILKWENNRIKIVEISWFEFQKANS